MKIRIDKTSSRPGFALILVMITVIALTTLVASFIISMNTEVRLARNSDYDDQLEWMGHSGVDIARFALANKSPEQKNIDALNQFWASGVPSGSNDVSEIISLKGQPTGPGTVTITIVDMERKWSINLVAGGNGTPPQKDVLQKALTLIGVTDAGMASTIEDSILDWCSPNQTAGFSGAKDDYYTHLQTPYYCKDGPIDDLSELLEIKGITPDIYFGINASNHPVSAYQQHGGGAFGMANGNRGMSMQGNNDAPAYQYGLKDFFSPMGGKLNINTADALTLQLIPGMDENTAARIIQQREDAPFQNIGEINSGLPGGPGPANVAGAPAAGIAAQGMASYIDVRSYVFDVQVDAQINGYHRVFHGIVSRAGGNAQQIDCVKFYWE